MLQCGLGPQRDDYVTGLLAVRQIGLDQREPESGQNAADLFWPAVVVGCGRLPFDRHERHHSSPEPMRLGQAARLHGPAVRSRAVFYCAWVVGRLALGCVGRIRPFQPRSTSATRPATELTIRVRTWIRRARARPFDAAKPKADAIRCPAYSNVPR